MPQTKERCIYIDYAKFFGIYLLLVWHYPSIWYEHDFQTLSFIRYISGFLMPFFFFSSGLLHKECLSMADTVKKCFHRLILPYLIFCFINSLCILWQHADFWMFLTLSAHVLSGFDCPKSMGMHLPSGVWWVVGSLWFVYSLTCIKISVALLETVKKKRKIWGTIIIWVFFLSCIGVAFFTRYAGHVGGFRLQSSCVGAVFYIMGMMSTHVWKAFFAQSRNVIMLYLIPTLACAFAASVHCMGWNGCYFLSINSCRMGNAASTMIAAGFFGAICFLMICRLLPQRSCSIVTHYSKGTIFILGAHWGLYQVMRTCVPLPHTVWAAYAYAIVQFFLFYPLLKLVYAYFPALIGYRK